MSAGEDPGARWTRLMRAGDFAGAWAVSDSLLGRDFGHLPRHLRPVWDGTPVAGRHVRVRCHRGMGDTLQCVRFLPRLREVAARVELEAQPELIPVLRGVRGVDALRPLDAERPSGAVQVEVMELPHLLRCTLAELPGPVPYLAVPPARLPPRRGVRIGVVWRAGDWDARRNLPAALLAPLTRTPGTDWYVLQRGAAGTELNGLRARRPPAPEAADVLPLARTMRALDLVLSVDSMPAHLAGALGVPVWTMLHAEADWRWLERREDSPWYPTMRLFRQRTPADWGPVVDAVRTALEQEVARRRSRALPAG